MDKIRVGILRGGAGINYETSIEEGRKIISYIVENLPNKCKPIDMLVDRDGVWHLGGIPIKLSDISAKVDIVWDTTSPSLSQIFIDQNIPVTRIAPFSKVLGTSKELLREHMKHIGVKIPRSIIIPAYQKDIDARPTEQSFGRGEVEVFAKNKARDVFEKFPSPWIVKSFTHDADMAIHVAKTFPELVNAIIDGVHHNKSILVEEFILGKNISTHTIPNFRNKELYTFPVSDLSGQLTHEEKLNFELISRYIFSHIHADSYLNLNFVLHRTRGIFLCSTSILPDFGDNSHLSVSCESIGVKGHDILEHMLIQAGSNI